MTELEVADWRRRVAGMYAKVRANTRPQEAHEQWCAERDALFASHPASPLLPADPLRETGLPYFPYDPTLRFEVRLQTVLEDETRQVTSTNDGIIKMRRLGRVDLPDPVPDSLDVWWFHQYGGGIFLPVKDGTSGSETYGGGRYLLDTTKGADLGSSGDRLIIDLNFLYHPSCRYNPAWECPLAPLGSTTSLPVRAGERL